MRKFLKNLIPAIPVGVVLGTVMFSHSCANTTTPPSGGPKDTIPPVIVKLYPYPGTKNVPVHKTQLEFTFDEYVVVKDQQSIFLSPPMEKPPKYKMKGKTLVIYFENDLDSNKTYTLDITNAVADNNEGNMFPGYNLAFSTGTDVDSMYRREYHLGGIMGWFRLWFDRGMAESPETMADAVLRMMGGTLHPMMDVVRRTRPGS